MILRGQDNKVLRDVSGEVFDENTADSKLILKIDTDQQTPNRLFYDGTGNVKQVTDKTQNIPFTQPDLAKRPVLNITEGAFEFDGVDDVLLSTKTPDQQIGLSDFTVEFWAYMPNDLNAFNGVFGDRITNASATNFISIYLTDTRLVNFRFGGTSIESVNASEYLFPLDEVFHVAACRKLINSNYRTFLYVNGLLVNTKNISDNIQHTNNPWILGRFSQNAVNIFKGSLIGFNISNFAKYPVDELTTLNRKLFNPNFQPFPYFKRYKEDGNKKLFFSSRYLEGAVVDINGEITSINSEIGSDILLSGVKPVLQNNSIFFGASAILSKNNSNYLESIGTGNFYFACWVNMLSVSGSNYFAYLEPKIYLFSTSTTILTQVGGQNTTIQVGATASDGYKYLTVLRKSGVVYTFLNGILQATNVNTVDLTQTFTSAKIGGIGGNFFADDILLSVGDAIINPTGYTIGDKVFQPPARRSLDNRFIQL